MHRERVKRAVPGSLDKKKGGDGAIFYKNKNGTQMESFFHLLCLTNPAQAWFVLICFYVSHKAFPAAILQLLCCNFSDASGQNLRW
jgi:hypothetical protein